MSVTEHVDHTESTAPQELAGSPLPAPLSMIAEGATCTLDGTCTPG